MNNPLIRNRHSHISAVIDIEKLERESMKFFYTGLVIGVFIHLLAGLFISYTPPENLSAEKPAVPEPLRAEFLSYKAGTIAIAGLADGINPCAFTTIVFLLSMLSRLGKKRRDLIVVGVGFTLAICIMGGVRENLEWADVPKSLRGAGITLITAAIMTLAFMGFSGMRKG